MGSVISVAINIATSWTITDISSKLLALVETGATKIYTCHIWHFYIDLLHIPKVIKRDEIEYLSTVTFSLAL